MGPLWIGCTYLSVFIFSFSHSTFWFILYWSCWQAMISASIMGKKQTTVTEILGWSEAEEVIREKEEWQCGLYTRDQTSVFSAGVHVQTAV